MTFIKYICASILFLITYYSTSIQPLLKGSEVTAQQFRFESQSKQVSMSYLYEKPSGVEKGTVLLLHGKNFGMAYWQTTKDYLIKNGYSVVVPEQLGFGSSSQPENYQYSLQQLALNTKLLLDSLHISKVFIIGHSMGGMLAVRFALMYPTSSIRLILEDPLGLEDWKTKVPYSSIDEEYKKELKKTREDLKEYMTQNYFHNDWKPEYETLLKEWQSHKDQKNFESYAKNMALTSDMIFTQPVCYEFGNLKIPTVLIIGQKDKTAIGKEKADPKVASQLGNYAELGKRVAAMIPSGKLIPLEGLGHIPHIENFIAFTQGLEQALKN